MRSSKWSTRHSASGRSAFTSIRRKTAPTSPSPSSTASATRCCIVSDFPTCCTPGQRLELIGSDESEPKLQILVLTRFLHANRYPLRSKTLISGARARRRRLGHLPFSHSRDRRVHLARIAMAEIVELAVGDVGAGRRQRIAASAAPPAPETSSRAGHARYGSAGRAVFPRRPSPPSADERWPTTGARWVKGEALSNPVT